MKPITKILVGLGTLWMLILPLLAFGVYFISILASAGRGGFRDDPPLLFLVGFVVFIFTMLCTVPIQYLTQGFYIVHIIRNQQGKDLVKIFLGLGIFFLPFIAMPIYYLIYILPDKIPDWALEVPRAEIANAGGMAVSVADETN